MNALTTELCEWGLSVIHLFQNAQCAPLTVTAKAIAKVFYVPGYLLLLSFICWCVDYKKSFRISVVLLFSASLNSAIKGFLKIPRPYTIDPSVGLDTETSWSTPSGHSQGAAAICPTVAASFPKWKRGVRLLIAILLPIIVGLSRIYLGVHYPTDVLTGLIFGYIISIGALLFWDQVAAKLNRLPRSFKILIAAIVVACLNAICPDDAGMPGALFGVYTGSLLLEKYEGFDAASGTTIQKCLRMLIGLVSVGVIYLGLKFILPGEDSSMYQLFRFARYLILGLAIMFALPMLFKKIKIAS